jgi:hypothetical protein
MNENREKVYYELLNAGYEIIQMRMIWYGYVKYIINPENQTVVIDLLDIDGTKEDLIPPFNNFWLWMRIMKKKNILIKAIPNSDLKEVLDDILYLNPEKSKEYETKLYECCQGKRIPSFDGFEYLLYR